MAYMILQVQYLILEPFTAIQSSGDCADLHGQCRCLIRDSERYSRRQSSDSNRLNMGAKSRDSVVAGTKVLEMASGRSPDYIDVLKDECFHSYRH